MIKSLSYSFKEAFTQMFRNKVMSLLCLFSIAAMLLVLGFFSFITVNINYLTESLKSQFDTIEVFLEDDTTDDQANAMAESLVSLDSVKSIEYISKDEAMDEFKERWGDKAYLLDTLSSNPLPNSLRVTLADLSGGELVAEIARTMIGVEDVRFYQDEVNVILRISDGLQKGALIAIAFLIIVSVVVVSNTIKLTVMARQDEIMIMKYVGATNWFVRGPLLTEGMLMGLFAAGIALAVTSAAYIKINDFFVSNALMHFTSVLVEPQFMIVNLIWIFISLGVSIGAFGSILSMRRFLQV